VNELALFAGAGGGILGGKLLGWRTVCAVEIEPYCREVLLRRQRDRVLPLFPIWDDVCTFDGRPWAGLVDVISGGFPCQDISVAGKGAGLSGAKSGLWSQMLRIVCEVRPRFVLVENSPALVSRGLDQVLGDLASVGYHAEWGVLGANHAGASHKRDRIWILAYANSFGELQSQGGQQDQRGWACDCRSELPYTKSQGLEGQRIGAAVENQRPRQGLVRGACLQDGNWWDAEPELGRVANGVAHRVDRIEAIGNGQVPAVVRLAWKMLTQEAK
jgi:DNA (cytosine-5)-methyltransferase 1